MMSAIDFYGLSFNPFIKNSFACPETYYFIEEGVHESFSSLFVFWVLLFSAHGWIVLFPLQSDLIIYAQGSTVNLVLYIRYNPIP